MPRAAAPSGERFSSSVESTVGRRRRLFLSISSGELASAPSPSTSTSSSSNCFCRSSAELSRGPYRRCGLAGAPGASPPSTRLLQRRRRLLVIKLSPLPLSPLFVSLSIVCGNLVNWAHLVVIQLISCSLLVIVSLGSSYVLSEILGA